MCSDDPVPSIVQTGLKHFAVFQYEPTSGRVLIDRNDLGKVKCCLQMTKYVSSTRPISIEDPCRSRT
jgi:hypothetical protein